VLTVGGIHIDIHVVVCVGSLLLVIFLNFVVTFALNVNTAVLGHLIVIVDVSNGLRSTVHGGVHDNGRSLAIGLGSPVDDVISLVHVNLICAVVVIVRGQVGLGLLRRELGRCGSVVVPG
jgi:hypothetical protein